MANALAPLTAAAATFAAVGLGGWWVRRIARESGHAFTETTSAWQRAVAVSVFVGWVVWIVGSWFTPAAAWAVAALFGAVLLMRTVPDHLHAARLYREVDEAVLEGSRARLDVLLGRPRLPIGYGSYGAWALRGVFVASRAHALGRSDLAFALLDALDVGRLREDTRVAYLQIRTAAAFATGRRDDARACLALAPARSGRPDFDGAIACQRALLEVLEGDVSDARFAEIERGVAEARGAFVASWRAVEAHARVARGDEPGARSALEATLASGDRAAVERVVRHGGPASPLAQRLLSVSPYRS